MVEDPAGNLILINAARLVLFDGVRSSIWKPARQYEKLKESFVGLGKVGDSITFAICEGPLANKYKLINGITDIEPLQLAAIPICASTQSPRSLLTSSSFYKANSNKIYGGKVSEDVPYYVHPLVLKNKLFVVNEDFAFSLQQRVVYRINSKTETIDSIPLPAGKWQAFLSSGSLILVNEKKQCYVVHSSTNRGGLVQAANLPVAALLKFENNLASFSDEYNDFIVADNNVYRVNEYNGKVVVELLLQLPEHVQVTAIRLNKDASILFAATLNAGLFIATKSVFQSYLFPANGKIDNIFYAHLRLDNGNILTKFGLIVPAGNSYTTRELKPFLNSISFYKNESGYVFESHHQTISKWTADATTKLKDIKINGTAAAFVHYKYNSLAFISSDTSFGMVDERDSLIQFSPFTNYGAFKGLSVNNDKIWIATDSGLVLAQPVASGMRYQLVYKQQNLKTIYADKKNYVWACVKGEGVFRYNPSGKVTKLPLDKNKSLHTVHNFYQDENGYFWLPTNNGLIQVWKNDLEEYEPGNSVFYYRHSIATGLPENEFNKDSNPYLNVSSNGELTFPSMLGIISFFPKNMIVAEPFYPVKVGDCMVDGKPVRVSNIILPHNFSKLQFTFSSPYFGPLENLLVYYRIPELDSGWQLLDISSALEINRLPFGNYTLQLRKYKGFGENKYDFFTTNIKVLKPWYLQMWFIFSVLFILLLVIYFVTKWIIRRKLEKSRLENLVIESELKSLRAQINPHFIQNIFNTLALQLRLEGVDKSVDSIAQLSAYIRNVLENSDITISTIEDELIFAENYLRMQQFIFPDLFMYKINVDEEVDTIGVFLPAMLLQPILENTIKHGFGNLQKGGEILITVGQRQ
ncbi:MAG: histidine kinase, partial [Chitinophagaceae bacterium]|nr:histidine kinase [Chitinophagaceae bacterium]